MTEQRFRITMISLACVAVVLLSFCVGVLVMRTPPAGRGTAQVVAVADPEPAAPAVAPVMAAAPDTVPPEIARAVVVRAVNPANAAGLRGGVGLGTWDTTCQFKDVAVVGSDGKSLLGGDLRRDMTAWRSSAGDWSATGGTITQASRAINVLTITGDADWTNYTYSMKAKRTDGTEGFLIAFAAQDAKNLYWWNIAGWGNTRSAIEQTNRGSKREISGSAVALSIETDKWYDIKIEVKGETAKCYFDGKLITTLEGSVAKSTLPDSGPPTVFNNGNGPQRGSTAVRTTPTVQPNTGTTVVRTGQLTVQRAQSLVRELALKSPNPYVRETAYHDRDADWSIDAVAMKFTVKIRGPQEKTLSGKLTPTTNGWATAAFDDEAALGGDWNVRPQEVLTPEEASRRLSEMCERLAGEAVLKAWGGVIKDVDLRMDRTTGESTASMIKGNDRYAWRIDPKARTFSMTDEGADATYNYSGRFGWDKNHKWMAWPIVGGMTPRNGSHRDFLAIPTVGGG